MSELFEHPRGAVRYRGQYRSDKYGVVDQPAGGLMDAVIRNVYRKNFDDQGVTQGLLINWIGERGLKPSDERWQIALERLVNYGLIEIGVSGVRRDTIVIHITAAGKEYARELIASRQLRKLPPDGPEGE